MKQFVLLMFCVTLLSCNNKELDSIYVNDSKTSEEVCKARSIDENLSITAAEADLPNVRVSCLKSATSCSVIPFSVRFYSPNVANIGTSSPNGTSMVISPLFVTEDDKFQVIAVIEHNCGKRHTLKISNGYGYTETIRSNSTIGTINYSGYIPLAHVGNSEQIIVTLTD